jgi:hypothetical protein
MSGHRKVYRAQRPARPHVILKLERLGWRTRQRNRRHQSVPQGHRHSRTLLVELTNAAAVYLPAGDAAGCHHRVETCLEIAYIELCEGGLSSELVPDYSSFQFSWGYVPIGAADERPTYIK